MSTLTAVRSQVQGKAQFDITLSVNKPATRWFRFTGGGTITSGGTDTTGWQVYSNPVHINLARKGVRTVEYYAEDSAGNV